MPTATKTGTTTNRRRHCCLMKVTTDLTRALERADYIVSGSSDAFKCAANGGSPRAGWKMTKQKEKGKCPVLSQRRPRRRYQHGDTPTRALNQRHLDHVVLDVTDDEPLPIDSPLWTHPHSHNLTQRERVDACLRRAGLGGGTVLSVRGRPAPQVRRRLGQGILTDSESETVAHPTQTAPNTRLSVSSTGRGYSASRGIDEGFTPRRRCCCCTTLATRLFDSLTVPLIGGAGVTKKS